jgi:hypothetical protein
MENQEKFLESGSFLDLLAVVTNELRRPVRHTEDDFVRGITEAIHDMGESMEEACSFIVTAIKEMNINVLDTGTINRVKVPTEKRAQMIAGGKYLVDRWLSSHEFKNIVEPKLKKMTEEAEYTDASNTLPHQEVQS